VRLWTIQHEAVLERLERQGYFYADGRRVWWAFREAYLWLRDRYREHNPNHEGRAALIWAWHCPKPDLRSPGHLEKGAPGVRLEIEVPDEQVLLSDFDGWHFRLNYSYLSESDADDVEWYAKTDPFKRELRDLERFRNRIAKEQDLDQQEATLEAVRRFHDEKERSWLRMFDLPLMATVFKREGMVGPHHEQGVQAVFERLELDQVRKITRFRGR
jgi:hypothetical protein